LAVDRRTEPWSALLDAGREDGRLVREANEGPGRAKLVELPQELHPEVLAALERMGIDSLYAHQAQALHAATQGPTIVTTGTASGKSMCFNLPTLHILCEQGPARALYLYPTKALAQDQARALSTFGLTRRVRPAIYDGDTPRETRREIRRSANVVLTNPDMLHLGILPNHDAWAELFSNLAVVVIDEAHVYRGVFGSHVGNVLRRLRRIAAAYGTQPIFMLTSATIANPVELAERLTGLEDVQLIDNDASPTPHRQIAVWNPPLTDEALGTRRSSLGEAAEILARLVRDGARAICFMKSRKGVEVLARLVKQDLQDSDPELAEQVEPYRAGYTPQQRRELEQRLVRGELRAVITPDALELGIDIGELDAVICAGYPGSVAGAWQRFGRAGRRGEESVAVLVASSAAVDQYIARCPETLFDADVESARIDPHNTEIVVQHLKCAAFELPFVAGEPYASLPADDTRSALRFLADHGVVHESKDRFHWSADAYPANHVSLRSVGWDNFVIIDKATGSALAELDWRATPTMLHEQAVYQHDGEQYQVERLDWENHKAFVTKVVPDYFTTAMSNRKVSVIEETARQKLGRAEAAWGEVSVVEKVVGYKKIRFHTHENAGYGDVRLPDTQMHTTSFRLTVPESVCEELSMGRAAAIEGLRGVAVALEAVSALALMCDPRDLGQTLGDDGEEGGPAGGGRVPQPGFDPTLFLFDNVPGGVGLAERIFERAPELLGRARVLIRGCGCPDGCPSCVGATETAGGLRKRAALGLLGRIFAEA
jgi:DEAD/DEAH box helicase domain-containing protein